MAKVLCTVNNKIYDVTRYPSDSSVNKWSLREESGKYNGIIISENELKYFLNESKTLKRI
jgi:hypothetical protein